MDGARGLLRNGWPLLALALIVRIAQIAATGDWTPPADSDPADYVRHAASIAHGHGMAASFVPHGGASALRPPAYPYFLGGVFALSGDSFTAGRLASALLGVASVALIGLIAQILWTRRVALIAMALAAVYPPLVLLSGTLLSEPLALPLVLGMLWLLLAYRAPPRPRWVAPVAGVLFALALLDRPALIVFAIPLVAALWSARRELVIALAVAALTIVPWTIRNAIEFDALIPISTQSGFLVGGTYNASADHDPVEPGAYRPVVFDPALRAIFSNATLDENVLSRRLGKAGRTYAKDHPGYVPRVLWFNSLRLLGLRHGGSGAKFAYYYQGIGSNYAKLARWSWYLLAMVAVAGLALGAMRGVPWWLWIIPLLAFASVIWISGDIRYRAPIEPFAIWCAAYAIAHLTDRSRVRQPQPTEAPPR
jgi:4-amino-4-deoxy-L-arabinose transferase-like glycosyltransferase